ncbi:winged helix-turn-helix transcriptional regulator [Qipengyuania huizhouensis]|nr:winged helix-turn-helix domain-containing protein [Qipengyuania huizhouensis]
MSRRQSGLDESARFKVLRLLEDNPNLSQRELAKAVGVSTGSAH